MIPSASLAERDRATGSPLSAEQVIERLRRWAELYGEPPCTADWNPSVARWRAQEWRVARYRLGDPETGAPWPSTTAAKRRFGGSFDAALRAAGLEPHRSGPRRRAARDARLASGASEGPGGPAGVAAGDALRAAEARARAAERELAAERRRHARTDEQLAEVRARARRLGDRARRARVAAEREHARAAAERARAEARVARGDALEHALTAAAEADARLAATEEIAGAATRDAQRARGLAAASLREGARLRAALAGALRRAEAAEEVARAAIRGGAPRHPGRPASGAATAPPLSPDDLALLRAAAPAGGPTVLAGALKALAEARATNDRVRLQSALGEVAAAAVAWRDRL